MATEPHQYVKPASRGGLLLLMMMLLLLLSPSSFFFFFFLFQTHVNEKRCLRRHNHTHEQQSLKLIYTWRVRLPASPPPPALDDQELCVIEGSLKQLSLPETTVWMSNGFSPVIRGKAITDLYP